ncbi:amidohydrolase family protein [Actinomadura montaniterrae]|uniref:Amidohydrolase family protein n=1 Tax=Actinomadura montaniterrae TaxID=1803903 RepID=A0A6L3VSV8_9ACTN|nr:amidohydrolase family protein [Actinomadura montaniterrae]KAB2380367.1 amidohydrolase family protein [Actinomadura montaniterrae]
MTDEDAPPVAENDPAPAPFAAPEPGRVTAYRGVSLIDGTGGPVRHGMAVVTDGPVIKAVVPDADLGPSGPPGAETVDVRGAFLLPGLIDAHQHLSTPPNRAQAEAMMRRQVYGGVTAIREMAGDLRQMADLARASLVGEIPGPAVHCAALMAGPGFFDDPRTHQVTQGAEPGAVPWMQAVGEDTDLPLAVAAARGTGAVAIKIYADLDAALVARITAEAHRQGMLVWAHAAVFPAMPGEVVAAGVDVVSHVHMLVHELSGDRPPSYRRQREHLADAYRRFLDAPADALDPLLDDMRRRGTILDATTSLVARMPSSAPGAAELAPRVLRRLIDRARHAGVTICAGTDYETAPGDAYPSLHDELRHLVRSMGMPPHEAIRAATAAGAAAVGLRDAAGTVEPGGQADFVIVEADPYEDIDHLRRVVTTVKRGRRHDRADYDRPAAGDRKGAPDGR